MRSISLLASLLVARRSFARSQLTLRSRSQYSRKDVSRVSRGGSVPIDGELTKTAPAGSLKEAFTGGITGSIAGVAQVLMFMWLRTAMNYQYRHGGSLRAVLLVLWEDGGVRRLYRGLPFAILQGPLTRFGSAAANTLVLGLRDTDAFGLGKYPIYVVTMLGSLLTTCYRCVLMPIDTLKTVSQVDGCYGFNAVTRHAFAHGNISILYTGAYAMAASTFMGHYPWFLTFNVLNVLYPKHNKAIYNSIRLALMGFISSIASDVASNPIRVIKTTKQSMAAQRSLTAIVRDIAMMNGASAFFTRGLSTRIIANGLQSIVFTVVWRLLLE
ncbi:hypothetical protein AURANDRAFT_33255 [Aureococcus anophagefferens]|uniref:Mitochondrial carrier protein n=1 Tax=Aureococcus anophagefferens TaxID=44056 RepID=F0YLG5_AURAN|nr:hypothetical protein AURANDRAFT_33255 [Aureococcus anophagefferens]EGB04047.1 hypothetical protein AURANDRAFT_33255 [Aureococcus anophagefferens]|eukprot:XP_009041324.1 hypothetical protein AURANDRAFT_33255 [Aureococcus anophagefferens]